MSYFQQCVNGRKQFSFRMIRIIKLGIMHPLNTIDYRTIFVLHTGVSHLLEAVGPLTPYTNTWSHAGCCFYH